jgi:hypothetical protein
VRAREEDVRNRCGDRKLPPSCDNLMEFMRVVEASGVLRAFGVDMLVAEQLLVVSSGTDIAGSIVEACREFERMF